jgi:F-box-like
LAIPQRLVHGFIGLSGKIPSSIFFKMASAQPACLSPIAHLPLELSTQIFSYLGLDQEELKSLLTVSKEFYEFLKASEAVLVIAASHLSDPLGYLLVLQVEPTYEAFFRLRKETTLFKSIETQTKQNRTFEHAYGGRKNPDFHKSNAAPRLSRAGFLLFHRIAITEGRRAKEAFARHLDLEFWAIIRIFLDFTACAVTRRGYDWVFPTVLRPIGVEELNDLFERKRELDRFIHELSFFSGLEPIHNYMSLTEGPPYREGPTRVLNWARDFGCRYLAEKEIVAMVEYESRKPEFSPSLNPGELTLDLTLHRNVFRHLSIMETLSYQGLVQNMYELDHPADDVLDHSGLLAAAEDSEETLIEKLKNLLDKDTRSFILIPQSQMRGRSFNHELNLPFDSHSPDCARCQARRMANIRSSNADERAKLAARQQRSKNSSALNGEM